MKNYLASALLIVLTSCTYLSVEELIISCEDIPFTIDVIVENADCGVENGSVLVSVIDGDAPFTFTIVNKIQNDPIFADLASGNYHLVVMDSNGCTVVSDFTVFNKDGVVASSTVTTSGCGTSQASIAIEATNGQAPYQYSINGGSLQSSNIFNDLSAGSYDIMVVDIIGCDFSLEQLVFTGESYAQAIRPIIVNSCAITGCHNGTQFPDLRELSNVQMNKVNIRKHTQSGFMPLGGSLSQSQIDAIACWIDDGAMDN